MLCVGFMCQLPLISQVGGRIAASSMSLNYHSFWRALDHWARRWYNVNG